MIHAIRRNLIRILNDTPLEKVVRRILLLLSRDKGAAYDRETIDVFKKVLGKSSNCIDVGAYRGEILSEMLKFATQGDVFAVEPVPENCAYLTKKYPRAHIFNMAVAEQPGELTFYYVTGRPARSGLKKQEYPDPNEKVNELTVRVDTLDNIIPNDVAIDLIKIDVEGAEHLVLKGAIDIIKRSQPVIIFEHDINTMAKYDVQPGEVYDLLNLDCGMRVTLMCRWLSGEAELTKDEFVNLVNTREEFYFMAY